MAFDNIHFYASPKTEETLGIPVGHSVTHVPKSGGGWTDRIGKVHIAKYGLAAGCTSVCGMLAKPGLTVWAEKLVATAGYTTSRALSLGDFVKECIEAKNKVGADAAERGSIIHKELEDAILSGWTTGAELPSVIAAEAAVVRIVSDHEHRGYTFVSLDPEPSFYHELGFGGRSDLVIHLTAPDASDYLYLIDFKTRDFDADDVTEALRCQAKGNKTFGRLTPRETEPMQIAANIEGQGGDVSCDGGGNLYLSRSCPGQSFLVEYSPAQLEDAWQAFNACLCLFHHFKTN